MKIPLNQKPYYNTDSIANNMATDDMMDCYLEPVPGEGFITRRRPGLVQFCDLGTDKKGDGIFYWENADLVIAVSGGRVFSVNEDGTFVEVVSEGEDESPMYSGENHENWNLGTGWQVPVSNQSTDNPPIIYKDLKNEYDSDTDTYSYPFEYGALAKNVDGTGQVTPVKANTTIKGVTYLVTIKPYVTAGNATYTLGGITGSTISGVDTITDYITTITTEGLVITPSNTSRMVLTVSWRALDADRDYPEDGNPVVFEDGQDTAGNPWLYMASGKLHYMVESDS